MALVPPYVASLTPYVPGKPIEEVEREYGVSDVAKLASNENALGPSPRAVEAARAACAKLHLYPDGSAYYLRNAIAAKLLPRPARANRPIFFAASRRRAKGLSVAQVHRKFEEMIQARVERFRGADRIAGLAAYSEASVR